MYIKHYDFSGMYDLNSYAFKLTDHQSLLESFEVSFIYMRTMNDKLIKFPVEPDKGVYMYAYDWCLRSAIRQHVNYANPDIACISCEGRVYSFCPQSWVGFYILPLCEL